MRIGDEVRLFQRNNGQPVFSNGDGKLLKLPAPGASMVGVITRFTQDWHVDLDCVDADGQAFKEEGVYILPPYAPFPRGGRYALLLDDDSDHP